MIGAGDTVGGKVILFAQIVDINVVERYKICRACSNLMRGMFAAEKCFNISKRPNDSCLENRKNWIPLRLRPGFLRPGPLAKRKTTLTPTFASGRSYPPRQPGTIGSYLQQAHRYIYHGMVDIDYGHNVQSTVIPYHEHCRSLDTDAVKNGRLQ